MSAALCNHGTPMHGVACPQCDAATGKPHPMQPVRLKDPYSGRMIVRCRECSLWESARPHRGAVR